MSVARVPRSRAARALRGVAASTAAALLAAASHAIAGGVVTWPSLLATAVLAAPLCVALASRPASPWRIALGVGASQFLYHWIFSGLGIRTGGLPGADSEPVSPHANHFAALRFSPFGEGSAATAELWMWIAHAVAALATVALLLGGERALLRLGTLVVRGAIGRVPNAAAWIEAPVRSLTPIRTSALRLREASTAPISHRGPPVPIAANR